PSETISKGVPGSGLIPPDVQTIDPAAETLCNFIPDQATIAPSFPSAATIGPVPLAANCTPFAPQSKFPEKEMRWARMPLFLHEATAPLEGLESIVRFKPLKLETCTPAAGHPPAIVPLAET